MRKCVLCVSERTSNRTNRKWFSQSLELDGSSVASGNQSGLGLLQAMLGQVEADLETLNPGAVPESSGSPKHHRTQGLTGFSVALISTLGRLVHVLKQVLQKVWKYFLFNLMEVKHNLDIQQDLSKAGKSCPF